MENSPGKKRVASGIITLHFPPGRRVGGVLDMLGRGWGTPPPQGWNYSQQKCPNTASTRNLLSGEETHLSKPLEQGEQPTLESQERSQDLLL